MEVGDISVWLFLVVIAFISCLFTYILIKVSNRLGIVDVPNHRSLHTIPKPRTGGVAILIAISLALIIIRHEIDTALFSLFPFVLFLAGLALVDDVYSISAIVRLLLQLTVAGLLVYSGLVIDSFTLLGVEISLPPVLAAVGSVLFIVWLINLYNFMDGMDGFSAGMAIFGFTTFAILAFMKGETGFALANLVIVSAAIGFLLFNLPPSRIFMGDLGSTLIGMLVALFSMWANKKGIFSILISVIVFTPFILDSTVTLVKRSLRGEKLWVAHRSHYYQRLVLLGLGHKKTLLLEYTWMLACSLVAIALFKLENFNIQLSILMLFAVICLGILILVDKKTRNIRI